MSSFFSNSLPPEYYARDLLLNLNIDEIPTPVEEICKRLGIILSFNQSLSCESLIVKKNGKTAIIVKNKESNELRNRFSIGHELGHYSIPSHLKETYECSIDDLNHYTPNKTAEMEANKFASELLMPLKHFHPDVKSNELSLKTIVQLSNKYETSVLSTAIRFIKNTEELGSIVLSKDQHIQWTISSNRFQGVVRDNGPLDILSTAYDFFQYSIATPNNVRRVPSRAWSNYFDDDFLLEETLSMPKLGFTLSVIRPTPEYVDEHYDKYYDY